MKHFALYLAVLACVLVASKPFEAQTAPPTASTFSVAANVVALSGGSPEAATDAGFRFAVTPHLELGTDNYIASGYHSHFGTLSYQLNFLSKQLNKTNLNGQNFRFGIKGGAGLVFPTGANQRVAGLAGGWFQYAPGGNSKFALEAGGDWISAQPHTVAVRFGPVLTF